MNPFAIAAVLIYGVLAMIAALVTAATAGSPAGAALVFVAAGLTYLFQMMDAYDMRTPLVLEALWFGVVVSLLLSIAVSLGAF